MALQLDKSIKGITCNYWKVLKLYNNYEQNSTICVLGIYGSKEAREESVQNFMDIFKCNFDGVDKSREDVYTALVAGNYNGKVTEETVDENGNPESVEINIFEKAINV